MQVISPVRQLLDQWLLLPLFADLASMALVLRSVRNRAGYALAALLVLLSLDVVAETWPEAPGMTGLFITCRAFLPPLVALFVFSYAGGRRLAGRRGLWAILLLVPSGLFAGMAISAGMPSSSPALPAYSLCYFGAYISYLLMSGMARSFTGDEPVLFLTAFILIIGSGPAASLVLPQLGIQLPLFPYFSAAAGAILAHAALRYKSFLAVPRPESQGRRGPAPPAGLFITRQGEWRRARTFFSAAVRSGAPGAAVTRTHPVSFRRQTGLVAVPVIWLANSSYEKALPPARVEVLSHTVRDMGEQAAGCVILVEDLDYLVTNAGLFSALEMLEDMRRQAGRSSMTIILSSDLLTDSERRDLLDIGVQLLPREGVPGTARPAASGP